MKKLIAVLLVFVCSFNSNAFADHLKLALVGAEKGTKGFQIALSLAEEIRKRTGIEIITHALPGERAIRHLKDEEIDGDWARVDGFENEVSGLIQIPEKVMRGPYLAYSLRNDIKIEGWRSLEQYSVAHLRGWKIIDHNLKPFHKKLFPVDSIESGFKVVAAGRADVFIHTPIVVGAFLEESGLRAKGVKALQPPLDFFSLYIYLLERHAGLAKRIEAALKAIKADGTYDKILRGKN